MGKIQQARLIQKHNSTGSAAHHLRLAGYSLEAALYILVGRKVRNAR